MMITSLIRPQTTHLAVDEVAEVAGAQPAVAERRRGTSGRR